MSGKLVWSRMVFILCGVCAAWHCGAHYNRDPGHSLHSAITGCGSSSPFKVCDTNPSPFTPPSPPPSHPFLSPTPLLLTPLQCNRNGQSGLNYAQVVRVSVEDFTGRKKLAVLSEYVILNSLKNMNRVPLAKMNWQ